MSEKPEVDYGCVIIPVSIFCGLILLAMLIESLIDLYRWLF